MYHQGDRCSKCNDEVVAAEYEGEIIYHCPDCNPECPNCGYPQDAYHGVQEYFWVCPKCNGSDGIDVTWCEHCGTPYVDDKRCDCEDDYDDEEYDD